MLQVIISMYFKRYRGTAHGIMFAGSTAGAFFYPQLLLFLRSPRASRTLGIYREARKEATHSGKSADVPSYRTRSPRPVEATSSIVSCICNGVSALH
ncbi:hypothetical protein HPB52_007895 [Rhipicephalus sanguineus]|uniref:Monocarboxylate transporter n=1 Tax=Rhipicephalus sanguineus TaxID=34632 RepID=A0A9D4PV36_RHISA|nr:hypothetical protein HPB52_007895 [Rhipicephalus sanguineus]